MMVTTTKKSKFADESIKEVLSSTGFWCNEFKLTQENIERVAEKLGGELRQAWLYGEWVNVAITFTQTYRIGRAQPEHNTKSVFIGEYLVENQMTRFVHVVRESLAPERS